jgi:hypothetical protein
MGLMNHKRGRLPECRVGKVRVSMLYQQVTLEEFLAIQYPSALLERYPEQASRERETEQSLIASALLPGDTLWLWTREGEWDTATIGIAVKRGNEVVRAWSVWWAQGNSDDACD